jgi:hypothetical protein
MYPYVKIEYYYILKREILLFSTTWIDLIGFKPSEISQPQKKNRA